MQRRDGGDGAADRADTNAPLPEVPMPDAGSLTGLDRVAQMLVTAARRLDARQREMADRTP